MEDYMDLTRYNMCNPCNMKNMNQNCMNMPCCNYKPSIGYDCYNMNIKENNEMPMNYGYYNYGYTNTNKMMKPMNTNYTPLHKIIYEEVNMHIKKLMINNMGIMPKSISMDMYKKELNEMLANLMKKENEIKKMMLSREEIDEKIEEDDRLFCPYCQGFLGNMLGLVFLNSLINGGCTFCY